MKEDRLKLIRDEMLIQFVPMIRNDVPMVEVNAAIDKVSGTIERLTVGMESAAVSRYIQRGTKPEKESKK